MPIIPIIAARKGRRRAIDRLPGGARRPHASGRPEPSFRQVGKGQVSVMVMRFLAILALAALAGPAAAETDDNYDQISLFGTVLERIRADHVAEPEVEALIEAAINGMLSSLDPHSAYLSPRSFKEMQVQSKGEFGGLGIEVTMENGFVKVVSPIDDTPAFRAGLKPGDLITHIDGEMVLGLTLGQAVDRMRGPVEAPITVTVRREDEAPFDVTIVRAVIRIQSVRRRAEDDVGYIRITSFNGNTLSGVEKAVSRLREEVGDKLRGYVLDLRNNPGGLLDQAISVSDAFLERGEIVSTRGRDKDSAQRFNAKPGDIAEGLPLVVLINEGSASASEIVAGALRDHRRAIVMGTGSFGKGSVQSMIPITGHGALKLTTARYYTPSGESIQGKGIVPDIAVKQAVLSPVEDGRRVREADLRGTLDKVETPDADGEQQPAAPTDYQLTRALDLLRALSFYNAGASH